MYTLLLVILIIDSLVLVAAVLLQSAKGGGLAASFGGVTTAADAFMGTRQAGNFLSKTGWWSGGIFLFLSFVLQIMSTRPATQKSILEQAGGPAPAPITAPATKSGAVPQSAVPLEPTPSTTPKAPPPTPKSGQAGGTKKP